MKKRMEDWFSRHGITARIVILFILLVIVPFFVMAFFVVSIFRDYSYSSLGNATMDSMSSVGSQISKEIRSRKEDAMFVYYNNIVELLSQERLEEIDKTAMEKQLSGSLFSNEGVYASCIIDREGSVYGVGSYLSAVLYMESYQEELIAAGGKCRWYVTDELTGKAGENKYILARSLNNDGGEHVGFLYMVMGDNLVTDAFRQLNSDYSVRYLVDEDGTILYSSDSKKMGEILDISALNTKKKSNYQNVEMTDGRQVIIASSRIWETGWYCVAVIEMKDIMQNALNLLTPFGWISVIYVAFLFVMLYMLQRYVFRPLGTLKRTMDQYAQGELQAMQIEEVGVGELRSLAQHFNSMTVRIDNLIRNYREEVEEKNRQKIMVLSAQLTPHFIYNALNTIKWVAVLNHQDNIQKLTESLIHIFMNSARVEDKGYTVGEELKLIENYAVIQKARFMNFDLVIEKEENCSELGIKKLIIQPIVENAIVHGLGRGKIKNTEIRVKVWADEDLHITVTDQGVGFDVEKWRSSGEKAEGHTNIGIGNVEKLIQMEYGEPYGMWIESKPGEGTKVSYLLPVIKKEGNRHDTDDHCG